MIEVKFNVRPSVPKPKEAKLEQDSDGSLIVIVEGYNIVNIGVDGKLRFYDGVDAEMTGLDIEDDDTITMDTECYL